METEKRVFIALEGIDGSGKSTQALRLGQKLREQGFPCYVTREPTDSPIGSLIHQIMTGRIAADNRVIASLFAADRLDHLTNGTDGILQKLDQGLTVVTDRYYFSSYAYHSVDVDMDWVIQANAISAGLLRPTATIFLDVPVEEALKRLALGRAQAELFEREERLRKVRELYFQAFDRLRDQEKVLVIDGSGSADQVFERLWSAAAPLLA